MPQEQEKFRLRWVTYNFVFHPYGDILWHLITGLIAGGFLVYSIIYSDYWSLIISLLSLIFFFHPRFYEPKLIEIEIDEEGIIVDGKKYEWKYFDGFEIFSNGVREYVYLVPHSGYRIGFDLPIENFFVTTEEVREKLNIYLDEYVNVIPFTHRLFRFIFP